MGYVRSDGSYDGGPLGGFDACTLYSGGRGQVTVRVVVRRQWRVRC